jgi:hypothetical protein
VLANSWYSSLGIVGKFSSKQESVIGFTIVVSWVQFSTCLFANLIFPKKSLLLTVVVYGTIFGLFFNCHQSVSTFKRANLGHKLKIKYEG